MAHGLRKFHRQSAPQSTVFLIADGNRVPGSTEGAPSLIRRADSDDFHLVDGMIHPPNHGMGSKNGDLPVTIIGAPGGEVTLSRWFIGKGFEPRNQALPRACPERFEVVEAGLPEPDLVRSGHDQGFP